MKVSSRIRGDVTVVSVHGRVLRHRADVFAEWIVAEMGDHWSGPVLLDARAMTPINSAGMRSVLRLFKRVTRHGGRFAVCGLAEGIDRIMDIHDSLEEALEVLSPSPEATGGTSGDEAGRSRR